MSEAATNAAAIWIGVCGVVASLVTGGFTIWGVFARLRQDNRLSERKEREHTILILEKDRDQFRSMWQTAQTELESTRKRLDRIMNERDDLEDQLRRKEASK